MALNLPEYGKPPKAGKWRKFIVNKSTNKRSHICPCIVWVGDKIAAITANGQKAFRVSPSSARAVAKASGVPLKGPSTMVHVIASDGQFLGRRKNIPLEAA